MGCQLPFAATKAQLFLPHKGHVSHCVNFRQQSEQTGTYREYTILHLYFRHTNSAFFVFFVAFLSKFPLRIIFPQFVLAAMMLLRIWARPEIQLLCKLSDGLRVLVPIEGKDDHSSSHDFSALLAKCHTNCSPHNTSTAAAHGLSFSEQCSGALHLFCLFIFMLCRIICAIFA